MTGMSFSGFFDASNRLTFPSRVAFGVSVAGEWSNAWNDCGLFLRGVDGTTTYGGVCENDSSTWGDGVKAGLLSFASAQMDALGDYFFWTWKVREPVWHVSFIF